ncbi:MAG TPA: hypothetical protein DEQ47_19540 [Solibacterales bacterium]|jgi:hypothetical protein|nr:hypothetical protein [Bryobacterales bacterium]
MPEDLGAVWRDQPEEQRPVNLEQLVKRRTRELYASTRSEIVMSIVAVLFFVAMMVTLAAGRFAYAPGRMQQVGLAAVIAWVLISLYWFRGRIWRKGSTDARAATGLEYYRQELESRRDHLRNAWVWHGPLVLACLIFAGSFLGRAWPTGQRLRSLLPLVIVLAMWTVFGLLRRRRQANELQRELDEIGSRNR